ncbi:MAG: aminoacyl-tRNA hydrolase, partial [Acidobacteria bacterium]|nr:aminoacyl-tRNA hydrolase [Acidobacteriota bacterium]
GNPGERYRGTRHNVGFAVIDELARRGGVTFEAAPVDALVAKARNLGEGALVGKPTTYMNSSGPAVAELARYYRVEIPDVLVVVDDVNLSLGRVRGRPRGSDGGHNGLKSIIEHLGTEEFSRLRIGIGRGDEDRELAGHVLSRFLPEERDAVERMVTRGADAAELFVIEGIDQVMNRFNAPEDAPAGSEAEAES